MGYVIQFEFLKFFKKKKNHVAILGFLIILIVFMVASSGLEKEKKEFLLESNTSTLNTIKNTHNQTIALMNNKKYSLQKESKFEIDEISLLSKKLDAIKNKNWKQELELSIKYDNLMIKGINDNIVTSGESVSEINNRINQNELLLKNNIEPIIEDCSIKGYNLIILLFINMIPLISVVLIILLFGDTISTEVEDGSIKLLLIQSISRSKILISKIISNIMLCAALFVFIFGSLFIVAGLIKGFGSLNYPLKFYCGSFIPFSNKLYGISYISTGQFIFLILPFFLLFVVCIISISTLVSTLINSSATSISVQIILFISIYVFTFQFRIFGAIAPFIPFTYANIPYLIQGISISIVNSNFVNYINGIIVMLVYSVICITFAIKSFNIKNILC